MGCAALSVIDTHALIWFAQGDRRLGPLATRQISEDLAGDGVLIPAIVPWELAHLTRRGKIDLRRDVVKWVEALLSGTGFYLTSLDVEIAVESATLDWDHRDPADRMLVATARHHALPLITADRAILDYAAAGHVRAIDARV